MRRAVVRVIGATRQTLPYVLKRTKDVDETVRKAAFKYVAEKVMDAATKERRLRFIRLTRLLLQIHIKSLTIAQREQVLQRGLKDRDAGVKNTVEKELSEYRAGFFRTHQLIQLSIR